MIASQLNLAKGSPILGVFGVASKKELKEFLKERETDLAHLSSTFQALYELWEKREKDALLDCDKQWQQSVAGKLEELLSILPSEIKGVYFCGIYQGPSRKDILIIPCGMRNYFK